MKPFLFITGMLFCTLCSGQSFTETITKELRFEKKTADNAILIANINGHVTVTGYEGEKVIVEVTRTITAKTQERLELGKSELKLGVMDRADTLLFFVDGGCNHFGKRDKEKRGRYQNSWGYYEYDWSGKRCDMPYDYILNFNVKVPNQVHVLVSTVNHGDITVEKVAGVVRASNINGSIKLNDLSREAWANTINGDVDITYVKNPQKDCRFYSLNGDINAHFQKELAANMNFKSFNGDLFTNVNKLERLPVAVNKEQKENMVNYKINGNRFKIGTGGALLDFETFNGDVYIKE